MRRSHQTSGGPRDSESKIPIEPARLSCLFFNVQTFKRSDVPTFIRSISFTSSYSRALLHFFASSKTPTLFFSIASALSIKKHNHRGLPTPASRTKMKPQTAESVVLSVRCSHPEPVSAKAWPPSIPEPDPKKKPS